MIFVGVNWLFALVTGIPVEQLSALRRGEQLGGPYS